MPAEAQILAVKELGMALRYLNQPSVWAKFCATYEGIYDRLGEFDTAYSQHGNGIAIPSLQAEWREFIRVQLDSIVLHSRKQYDSMWPNKAYVDFILTSAAYSLY